MGKKVQTMQPYGSNRGRPYDQNRDSLRSQAPSQEMRSAPRNTGTSGNYGFNGEPLSRPPSRSASGAVRRSRTDNSIEFPAQPRRTAAQQAGGQRRRASGANRNRTARSAPPRSGQARSGSRGRPAQNARGNAQQRYKNQRLRPAQQTPRDPVRREKRKKRRMTRAAMRRRRIIRRLTAFGLLLCVIVIGVYLTVTMLFKINSIQVQTADGTQVTEIAGYSAESILQTLGVQLEENIFSFDPAAREAELERQFPLLDSIRVERDYPNTVVVRVTEATPAYAIQTAGGWLTLSDKFKILSSDAAQPAGLCTLYGGDVLDAAPGVQLAFAAEAEAGSSTSEAASAVQTTDTRMEALTTLRSKLEEYGLLQDVTRMEFADTEQIAFLYQDRISVLLGTLNDLDYKLDRVRYMLNNEDGKGCAATDSGRLDFSHVSASSNRKIYFAQGEPTLPSCYVVPPAPEVPEETADPAVEADPAAGAGTAEDAAADTADTAPAAEDAAQGETPLTDPANLTANNEENPM